MVLIRALSIHAHYTCRRSGACCSSGWPIPVEPEVEADLRQALATGSLVVPRPSPIGAGTAPPAPRESSPAPLRTSSVTGGDSGSVFAQGREALVTFRVVQDGQGTRCVFLDRQAGNACAVHGQLGASRQAAACRLFPRVAVAAPDGVSLTLSHYCEGAADLLFDDSVPLGIVENPPAFPEGTDYEGLDATRSLGPWLRPGVLLGWEALRRWEAHALRLLQEEGPVDAALSRLASLAEALRAWTPGEGEFSSFLGRRLEASGPGLAEDAAAAPRCHLLEPASRPAAVEARAGLGLAGEDAGITGSAPATSSGGSHLPSPERKVGPEAPPIGAPISARPQCAPSPSGCAADDLRCWRLVAATIPASNPRPEEPWPEADEAAVSALVAEGWPALTSPVRRWLAARTLASWLLLQGDGLRTFVTGLEVAAGVLRAEAGRGCREVGRPLDGPVLREAVRRADLLLVHLADPEALARRLSVVERASLPEGGFWGRRDASTLGMDDLGGAVDGDALSNSGGPREPVR